MYIFVGIIAISCDNETKIASTSKELYTKNCIACHGEDGKKGLATAADLSVSKLTLTEQKQIITNGKSMMSGYKSLLSNAEIDSVLKYIQTFKN